MGSNTLKLFKNKTYPLTYIYQTQVHPQFKNKS